MKDWLFGVPEGPTPTPTDTPTPTPTVCVRSIGGYVWNDLDCDRLREYNEPVLAGAVVCLRHQDERLVGCQTTGSDGFFLFSTLEPDIYLLTITCPPCYPVSCTPYNSVVPMFSCSIPFFSFGCCVNQPPKLYLSLIMKGWPIWVTDTPTPTPTPFDYYWEPNDTFEQATIITPTMNPTYIGVIGTAIDVDFYQFGVTAASAQVYISLNHLPQDYDLYLYDGNRTLIDYSINGGLANEYITRTLTSGLYYIKVSTVNGSYDYRPYTLQVTLVPSQSPAALMTPHRATPGYGNKR
ncbi:MAG: hypothetical protein FJ026_03950 [Chloroflexi bacterium]|nr:hypothetical protein [Chloroflexota bacterium]